MQGFSQWNSSLEGDEKVNYPDGYQEMSTEEHLYWESVVEHIEMGMSEEEAKLKASQSIK